MKLEYKYAGRSGMVGGLEQAKVALATNTLREATFFNGKVGRPLLLREGLAALYDVVVSDKKYHPRDRPAFSAWLEEQDRLFLAGLEMKDSAIKHEIEVREARLAELRQAKTTLRAPFHAARREYFEYVWQDQYELEYLLDPVITVHPDELSFEVFSRDESTYGRLATKHDLFETVDAFECGTTNIDYSLALHTQLGRMRSYRTTRLDIGAGGMDVATTGQATHREKKIELPDSWLMGFHQVHSVMTLGLTRMSLAPVDLFNICRFLRRHKAKESPRALRWELEPGRRARVVFEPWEHAIELSPQHLFEGDKAQTIRTWGRRRLEVLARLLPLCERAEVYLAGHGLPSIFVLDLGDMTFTLGLSGWTDADWTGQSRFGLLSRRLDVTADDLATCYAALREARYATAEVIAETTGLGVERSRSTLNALCQVGRGMYDLGGRVYRHRDLLFAPFDANKTMALLAASETESDPKAKAARAIFEAGNVRFTARRPVKAGYKLSGSAKGVDGERVRPLLSVDHEGQILDATCTCRHFRKHRLTQGPCQHMLALRLAHMSRLAEEDSTKGGA